MFHDYPPYEYLFQVAEHCCSAVSTYMTLWKDRDAENKIFILKKDIGNEYLMSVATFLHHLRMLVKEGLVSIQESPKMIEIELVGYDFNAHEKTLC